MKLTDMLASIGNDAKKIRESMNITDPRREAVNLNEGLNGYHSVRRKSRDWDRRVAEATNLVADVMEGSRPYYHLKEAMTTSDFPYLMGDMMYRQLLGNYTAYPVTWPSFVRRNILNDFRTLNMLTLDGGQGTLAQVSEKAPYPETSFTEGKYTLAVLKYGRRYGISWEMTVNDDLNAFKQRPQLMAVGARRSEDLLATQLMAGTTGPNTTFFTAGNKNIVTGNPSLSIQGLQTAFSQIKAQLDTDGQPIIIDLVTWVVPPALEITARNIMNATEIWLGVAGGALDQRLNTVNWMRQKVQLVVNSQLPLVSTTNGDTSWYLVANPDGMGRPAFNFGFLRGHEQPQLWMKSPDAVNIGGGGGEMEGSFDNDTLDYKLRHVIGAAQCDPKMAVASNGTDIA